MIEASTDSDKDRTALLILREVARVTKLNKLFHTLPVPSCALRSREVSNKRLPARLSRQKAQHKDKAVTDSWAKDGTHDLDACVDALMNAYKDANAGVIFPPSCA